MKEIEDAVITAELLTTVITSLCWMLLWSISTTIRVSNDLEARRAGDE